MPINATNEELGFNVGPPLELQEFSSTLGELLNAQFQPSESVTGRALQAIKLRNLEQPGAESDISQTMSDGSPVPAGLVYSSRLGGLTTLDKAQQAREQNTQGDYVPPRTIISKQDALAKAKQEGVKVEVGDNGITEPALNYLIERRREEILRQDVIDRYRGGVGGRALGVGASFLGQAVDPLNIAAVFVPEIFGPIRTTLALRAAATAGERALIRGGIGAVEGAVGVAALEPASYIASQKLQDDYTLTNSLQNIAFGSFLGAGLHAVGGAIFDAVKGRSKLGIPAPSNVLPTNVTPGGVVVARPRSVDEVVSELSSIHPTAEVAARPADVIAPTTVTGESIPRFTGKAELPDLFATTTAEAKIAPEAPALVRTARSASEVIAEAVAILNRDPSQRTLSDLIMLKELSTPELKRAAEIQARPGFTHTLEEKLFLKDILSGGEADYINQRIAQALKRTDEIDQALPTKRSSKVIERLQAERDLHQATIRDGARRLSELGIDPYKASSVLERISAETKAAALKAAIAQDLQGKLIDVAEIVKQDPASGYTSSPQDIQAFFDRQLNSTQIGLAPDDSASLYGALRLKDPNVGLEAEAATSAGKVSEAEIAATLKAQGVDDEEIQSILKDVADVNSLSTASEREAVATLKARGVDDAEIQDLLDETAAITQKGERLAQAAEVALRICEVI